MRVRKFKAAEVNRLTESFSTFNTTINADIYHGLRNMRARSRDLWANNEYAKRFFSLLTNNVVGPQGFKLQNRALRDDGTLDTLDNNRVERHWRMWSKRGNCDVTGRLSRIDVERIFIETVARDGECLIQRVPNYDNEFRYALKLIDADRLDINKNESENPRTGNRIVMGIELNQDDRPVAYHILRKHPDSYFAQEQKPQDYIRIPADQMIHGFICHRPEQIRGIPWMHAAMLGLNDLGGYRDAAVIAARVGAAKMGFWKSEDSEGAPFDGSDSAGNLTMEVEPGSFDQIPAGTTLERWDPAYPHDQFEAFNKAVLRGISGGLNVAYHTLSGDLESVNLATARIHLLEEREAWMFIQKWESEILHDSIFPEWLQLQLSSGMLAPLPPSRFDKFNAATWQPRRWKQPDPFKESQANALNYAMRLTSLRQLAQENGQDADELWLEIAEDQKKLRELGIPETMPWTVQVLDEEQINGNGNAQE